jgi:ketosteroid isomerase-like protein
MGAKTWQEAVLQIDVANRNLVQGDATDLKNLYSHREDVTVFGGFGGSERGWKEVGPRLDWAAAHFSDGSYESEILNAEASGDLAYIVSIETNRLHEAGKSEEAILRLRVTQIFRREDGEWRLTHRHADQQVDKRSD